MKVSINRVAAKVRTFETLEAGQIFGFRENPIILMVLNEHDRSGPENAVVINPANKTDATSAGRTIMVPKDREVVLVTELHVTLEF